MYIIYRLLGVLYVLLFYDIEGCGEYNVFSGAIFPIVYPNLREDKSTVLTLTGV